MKPTSAVLGVFVSALAAAPALAQAPPHMVECESASSRVKGVTFPGVRSTAVPYNTAPTHFDPVPLLATRIEVSGEEPSCLVAHFSTEASPLDNWVVFQVRVDGVPMRGHTAGLAGVPVPVVYDPDESTASGPPRMVSYDFFTKVEPGIHLVEVMWAGCCSAVASGATVQSPVLTLEYQ
jgi:hypothetical protein